MQKTPIPLLIPGHDVLLRRVAVR